MEANIRDTYVNTIKDTGLVELDFAAIDISNDDQVSRDELITYLKEEAGLTDQAAAAIADELISSWGADTADAAVNGVDTSVETLSWDEFRMAVDDFSNFTLTAVNTDLTATDPNAGTKTGGEFVLYDKGDGNYGWAVRGDDGKYYDTKGVAWDDYAAQGVQLGDVVDSSKIVRTDGESAEVVQLDAPPAFATAEGSEWANRTGTWFEVENENGEKNYVFVEEKFTPGEMKDNKGYLDIYVIDSEGKTMTSMTGDPHVDADGDGNWTGQHDFHYTSGSSFRIGDLEIQAKTTDHGNSGTYNTEVSVGSTDQSTQTTVSAQNGGNSAIVSNTSESETLGSLMEVFSSYDAMDIGYMTGHSAALLVFLESADLLDDLIVDVLGNLSKQNEEISKLRDLKNGVSEIRDSGGFKDKGDEDKVDNLSQEDQAKLILADQKAGGQQFEGYAAESYIDANGQEQYIIRSTVEQGADGKGKVLYSTDPNVKVEGELGLSVSKKQIDNLDKAIDGKIQELTGNVELVMTRVKNFLTKREAFGGSTGSINQGLGSMLQRVF